MAFQSRCRPARQAARSPSQSLPSPANVVRPTNVIVPACYVVIPTGVVLPANIVLPADAVLPTGVVLPTNVVLPANAVLPTCVVLPTYYVVIPAQAGIHVGACCRWLSRDLCLPASRQAAPGAGSHWGGRCCARQIGRAHV